MNASELRIGNWIYYWKSDVYGQITGILSGGRGDHMGGVYIDNGKVVKGCAAIQGQVKPIPLTEEWLEQFGICFDAECYGHRLPLPKGHVKFSHPRWIDTKLTGEPIESPFLRFDATHTDVYYVHQLQNLYFAITGQELELKIKQQE